MIVDNGTRDCGSASAPPTVTFDVDPQCVNQATTWTVRISYQYFGRRASFTVDVGGTAPAPVDSSKISFDSGTWDPTSPAVVVHYTGSYGADTLNSLSWREDVMSDGVRCGSSTAVPTTGGNAPQITVDLTACPPTTPAIGGDPPVVNTYTLTVHYDDDSYGTSHDYPLSIIGSPPQ
jgi:hypothetical protein